MIDEDGGISEVVQADVTSEESCKNAVKKTIELYGALHILVNIGELHHSQYGNFELTGSTQLVLAVLSVMPQQSTWTPGRETSASTSQVWFSWLDTPSQRCASKAEDLSSTCLRSAVVRSLPIATHLQQTTNHNDLSAGWQSKLALSHHQGCHHPNDKGHGCSSWQRKHSCQLCSPRNGLYAHDSRSWYDG
jgi:hypothetical protein